MGSLRRFGLSIGARLKLSWVKVVCVLASLALGAVAPSASAQVLPKAGALDLGYYYQSLHRDLKGANDLEAQWAIESISARFSPLDRLSLQVYGLFSNVTHDEFPGQRFSRYTAGGNATVEVYRWQAYALWLDAGAVELIDRDRSDTRNHKRIRTFQYGARIATKHEWDNSTGMMWLGLASRDDIVENYFFDGPVPTRHESDTFGGVHAGANYRWRGIGLSLDFVFTDHPESFVAIDYRLHD